MKATIQKIKELVESAILEIGASGKKAVINSSQTINLLHEMVKKDLVKSGINPSLIHPPMDSAGPEIQLAGFLKLKTQDICIFPNHLRPQPESIKFNGLHTGKTDPYGELFSSHILSINLRSQLSSLAKNIDTMFERTYAEPLNLHRRLPNMVLGEVYLISARELDSDAVERKEVRYKSISKRTRSALEAYIHGFAALNRRILQGDDFFKYERVALIIVDFSENPARIYESIHDLISDGLLDENTTCSLKEMTYRDFIHDLLQIHERRFGSGKLT